MILIVGAGPAGLSAAYHLQSDHLILEREPEPGGLCRSFELGGTTFDLGGHVFFTRHDYVRALITGLSSTGLYTQPRNACVYSHGTYIPYPFQTNLHGLPINVVRECLTGLYEALADRRNGRVRNVKEWINRSFGPGISRHFLTPYNEKLWSFPLDEISPEWTSERVVTADFDAIVAGALTRGDFKDFPNATVAYPAEGGFWNLYEGFVPLVADRLRRSTVEAVNLRRRYVITDTGERLSYDYLISTMPLNELVAVAEDAPASCRQAAASLRYTSLYLVNLVIDRPGVTEMQRVYVADPSIPFHKLVLNSNSSASLRSLPRSAIQGEISWSPYKRVDCEGLEQRVLDSLIRMGIVQPSDHVVKTSVVTLEYAYPIYTRQTADARKHLLKTLERKGVFCAGRFGEWLYINSDDAVMRGKLRAEALNTQLAGTRS